MYFPPRSWVEINFWLCLQAFLLKRISPATITPEQSKPLWFHALQSEAMANVAGQGDDMKSIDLLTFPAGCVIWTTTTTSKNREMGANFKIRWLRKCLISFINLLFCKYTSTDLGNLWSLNWGTVCPARKQTSAKKREAAETWSKHLYQTSCFIIWIKVTSIYWEADVNGWYYSSLVHPSWLIYDYRS